MPTPFQCHWCDKPTMNETGICIECEQRYEEGNKDIAATVRELEKKSDKIYKLNDSLLLENEEQRDKIKWLKKGLKLIADGRDDMNAIYVKQQAQAILDGEPTTADEYNDEEDVQLGASIVKSNNEVSGVFITNGEVKDIDYFDNENKIDFKNRTREKKIEKASIIKSIGYRGED